MYLRKLFYNTCRENREVFSASDRKLNDIQNLKQGFTVCPSCKMSSVKFDRESATVVNWPYRGSLFIISLFANTT